MNDLFAGFTSLVLSLLLLAVFLSFLFLVVRSAVEQGVRRALKNDYLRPWPPGR
jgi:ABC-type lipoprotein release transport system permease subunit